MLYMFYTFVNQKQVFIPKMLTTRLGNRRHMLDNDVTINFDKLLSIMYNIQLLVSFTLLCVTHMNE